VNRDRLNRLGAAGVSQYCRLSGETVADRVLTVVVVVEIGSCSEYSQV
jgi:hypothetical protein